MRDNLLESISESIKELEIFLHPLTPWPRDVHIFPNVKKVSGVDLMWNMFNISHNNV